LHAFIPAADDHAFVQGELERLAAVLAGVELGALFAIVVEPAGVVHLDVSAADGFGAFAHNGVFILQARGGGGQGHGVSLEIVNKEIRPAGHARA
jgi:hypothetical protein